jgi:hypothetical protein
MKAIDDLKEVYPELEIGETLGFLFIRGDESDVDCADARMDKYIPTEYRRLQLYVDYEAGRLSTRTYRKSERGE